MFSKKSIFGFELNFFDIEYFKENKIVFHEVESPKVSIIIPVYNEISYTLNCLFSISKSIQNIDFEVIVVNDNSTDETKNLLEKIHNLRLINNKENLGFLKNINLGISASKGEFILILNNDVLVLNNIAFYLKNVFETHENVGAVGAMTLFKSLRLQEAGAVLYKDGSAYNVGSGRNPFEPQYNFLREVDYCSGCCLMFKKNLPSGNLNLLDEHFLPAYYEETDLCMRIKFDQNLKIIYQPLAKIIHFESISYSDKKNNSKFILLEKNKEKFFNRWQPKLLQIEQKRNEIEQKSTVFVGTISNFNALEVFEKLMILKQSQKVSFFSRNKILNDFEQKLQQNGIEVISEFQNKFGFKANFRLKMKSAFKPQNVEVVFLNNKNFGFKLLAKIFFFNKKINYSNF
jgi:GT2 family glycosyltransferase